MKKTFIILGAVCFLLCGCTVTSTVDCHPGEAGEVSQNGKLVKWHLRGYNRGLYLFYGIPLWSGKPNRPNKRDFDTFQHHLRDCDMIELLDRRRDFLGAETLEDVQIRHSSSGWWSLWILWHRSSSGSAVACGGKESKEQKRILY